MMTLEWVGLMRLPRRILRLVMAGLIMGVLVVAGTVLAGTGAVPGGLPGAAPAWASSGPGWVRLAHLSPNAPPMDVYLYSFGDPSARVVLRHVSYGMVSPYEEVPQGDYIVSMRAAGAAPT